MMRKGLELAADERIREKRAWYSFSPKARISISYIIKYQLGKASQRELTSALICWQTGPVIADFNRWARCLERAYTQHNTTQRNIEGGWERERESERVSARRLCLRVIGSLLVCTCVDRSGVLQMPIRVPIAFLHIHISYKQASYTSFAFHIIHLLYCRWVAANERFRASSICTPLKTASLCFITDTKMSICSAAAALSPHKNVEDLYM